MAVKLSSQNLEAERSVLGTFFIDADVFTRAVEISPPQMFHDARHRTVAVVMLNLLQQGRGTDFITLTDHLRTIGKLKEAGEVEYVSSLMEDAITTEGAEQHAKIVRDHFLRKREIGRLNQRITDIRQGVPLEEVARKSIDAGEDLQNYLIAFSDDADRCHASVMFANLAEDFEKDRDRAESLIPFTIPTINNAMGGGCAPGTFILLIGPPKGGKTTLALQQVAYAASKGAFSAFFSLEQRSSELREILVGQLAKIPGLTMRNRKWKDEKQKQRAIQVANHLKSWPLYIFGLDTTNPAKAWVDMEHLITKKGVRFIVLDHLQLLTEAESNESAYTYKIKDVSRRLKLLAGKFGVVILLICQQQVNSSSLMIWGSATPLQDADVVMVYQKATKKRGEQLQLKMNRLPGGETPTVPLQWDASTNRVAEVDTKISGTVQGLF